MIGPKIIKDLCRTNWPYTGTRECIIYLFSFVVVFVPFFSKSLFIRVDITVLKHIKGVPRGKQRSIDAIFVCLCDSVKGGRLCVHVYNHAPTSSNVQAELSQSFSHHHPPTTATTTTATAAAACDTCHSIHNVSVRETER